MQVEKVLRRILEKSYDVKDMNICVHAAARICFEMNMHSNLEGCFIIANYIQEVGMEVIANETMPWIKFLELVKKEQIAFNDKTNF